MNQHSDQAITYQNNQVYLSNPYQAPSFSLPSCQNLPTTVTVHRNKKRSRECDYLEELSKELLHKHKRLCTQAHGDERYKAYLIQLQHNSQQQSLEKLQRLTLDQSIQRQPMTTQQNLSNSAADELMEEWEQHKQQQECHSNDSRMIDNSEVSKQEMIKRQKDFMKKQLHLYKQQMHYYNGLPHQDCCELPTTHQ